jgi:hypothetical protein
MGTTQERVDSLVVALGLFKLDTFTEGFPRLLHAVLRATQLHVIDIHHQEHMSVLVIVHAWPIFGNEIESSGSALLMAITLPIDAAMLMPIQCPFKAKDRAPHGVHGFSP